MVKCGCFLDEQFSQKTFDEIPSVEKYLSGFQWFVGEIMCQKFCGCKLPATNANPSNDEIPKAPPQKTSALPMCPFIYTCVAGPGQQTTQQLPLDRNSK